MDAGLARRALQALQTLWVISQSVLLLDLLDFFLQVLHPIRVVLLGCSDRLVTHLLSALEVYHPLTGVDLDVLAQVLHPICVVLQGCSDRLVTDLISALEVYHPEGDLPTGVDTLEADLLVALLDVTVRALDPTLAVDPLLVAAVTDLEAVLAVGFENGRLELTVCAGWDVRVHGMTLVLQRCELALALALSLALAHRCSGAQGRVARGKADIIQYFFL